MRFSAVSIGETYSKRLKLYDCDRCGYVPVGASLLPHVFRARKVARVCPYLTEIDEAKRPVCAMLLGDERAS